MNPSLLCPCPGMIQRGMFAFLNYTTRPFYCLASILIVVKDYSPVTVLNFYIFFFELQYLNVTNNRFRGNWKISFFVLTIDDMYPWIENHFKLLYHIFTNVRKLKNKYFTYTVMFII